MHRTLWQTTPVRLAILGAAAMLAASGCAGSDEMANDLAAMAHGQLPTTPLPRGAFDAELTAACGGAPVAAAPDEGEVFGRKPYLQQVSAGSAMLLWTSTREAPLELVVTTPEGDMVARIDAQLDESASPRDGRQFQARVPDLEPATIYCYELHDGDRAVSPRTGFRTAPAADTDAPVTFVAVGDMGTGRGDQHAVFDQIRAVPFDLMLALGDNAYDSGTLEQFEMHLFDVYAPVLGAVPMFPISGNHEYHTRDAEPFREVFALPENGGEAGYERWYSFDWGPVHFVALDTEKTGAEQAAWLEQDLAQNQLPWTVVLAHRPPYSSGHHGSNAAFRLHYGPILERYQVPLVLSGHEHSYERTETINGTTYIVSGGGGKETRGVGSSDFTAFSEAVLHFLWIRVEGDELEVRAIDGTGAEFDSVILRRP